MCMFVKSKHKQAKPYKYTHCDVFMKHVYSRLSKTNSTFHFHGPYAILNPDKQH